MDLSTSRALEGCEGDATLSALVLNILEAVDEVGNAWQAEEEAEAQSPKTREKREQKVS
jgi:hypothetical protein